jgi:sulfide:quinone oxidoreductase
VSPVAPWRVVVAGGGVAGVEALLGLAALGEGHLQLALVTPGDHFTLRQDAVAEPFGGPPAPTLPIADIARETEARFIRNRVTGLAPGGDAVLLAEGGELAFDALVLAVGARARPLHPDILTFAGPQSVPAIRRLVDDLTHGRAESVAFVVPAGPTWPLPMYELALMTRRREQRRRVVLVTPEPSPLALFGPVPSRAVAELLDAAGVELHTGAVASITADGSAVQVGGGAPLELDRIVATPMLEGPRLDGVPYDAAGFIPVDEHCRVPGTPRVYAAGDGTGQPVKHGGLAAAQSYAAIRHLVAEAGGMLAPAPFRPVLRGRLLTGGIDHFLRRGPDAVEGEVHDESLWEPAAKVAGQYLGPWVAYRPPELGRPSPGHRGRSVPGLQVDARLTDPSVLGLDPYGSQTRP